MNLKVVYLALLHTESCQRESSEPRPVEVDLQGVIGHHQAVDSQIKFFSSDQVRIFDVALYDVRLDRGIVAYICSDTLLPFADLTEFCKKEDALALRPACA